MGTRTFLPDVVLDESGEPSAEAQRVEPPRWCSPDRRQMLMQAVCLEDCLPGDHVARTIWAVVEGRDLSAFMESVKARGAAPGRPATDVKLLIALWLHATMEGVGSGRELERLCGCHDVYRWLCGGVSVNYHTLNDFRVGHDKALDDLFTQILGVLTHQGVVSLRQISQDGMRVRASAGLASFRREKTLREHLEAARRHVEEVKRQGEGQGSPQRRAAQERAARERVARIAAALAELPKIQQEKDQQKDRRPKERPPRASKTDATARVMKMPDGGFRPAYNVQVATDTGSRAIVGVEVTNHRSDAKESTPLREQAERRIGQKVHEHLMDGGFVRFESIEAAEQAGTRIYAPPPNSRKNPRAYAARKTDGRGVAAWRQRMATPEAQMIYRKRAATSETVNADLKTFRGLTAFGVRGLAKVRCVALWSALAYNLMHFASALLI